ncbi:hypothetical protein Jiend_31230 [Micromonospora endophytica]|nr:hypothetical protein Jiend_31230 [Micromonospora endophytica]
MRARDWWKGPDLYVLVDDYDLVAGAGSNPLTPLLEFLPQARDIGLHLIIARRTGGASRALYEPVLMRLREISTPGIVMSGNRDEGVLLGTVRPGPLPPGVAGWWRDVVAPVWCSWCTCRSAPDPGVRGCLIRRSSARVDLRRAVEWLRLTGLRAAAPAPCDRTGEGSWAMTGSSMKRSK